MQFYLVFLTVPCANIGDTGQEGGSKTTLLLERSLWDTNILFMISLSATILIRKKFATFFVHLRKQQGMKYNNWVFNLVQIIFTLVGFGLIAGGYFASPGSKTDDGYPLNYFLYVLGGFFIVWPIVLFGVIRFFLKRAAAREAYLINNGIKGKARVLNMRNTGVYINRIPQMVMDLQVTTDLGEHYETSYKKTVPMQYYNIIRPDVDLPVYIDPNDRNKLFIDFQQAWMDIAKKS